MKELVGNKSNNSNGRRTAAEKEKTKMRERERRAITTKIFQGLRQHGGYRLSPRSDINEVLRHLAVEAGWIIEPDGTTYRSSSSIGNKSCQHCGVGGKHGKATPTSSIVGPPSGGAGECSTTTSPLRATLNDGDMNTPTTLYSNCTTSALLPSSSQDTLLAVYMYGDGGGAGGGAAVIHQSFESEHAGRVTSGDSI